ncbi:MAG TPA: hypothetical protein VMJ35_05655 [Dongiaceae bacterium]|nr:hypothetical protein [Dongiaceae bacterium]
MSVYTPHFAPIVFLVFVGTAALLLLCVFVVVIGALQKSRPTVVGASAAGFTILLGYTTVLFSISAFSRDVEITRGAWKYFCEIDCHIAYSVGELQVVDNAGREFQPITASGRFAIVQLKSWFDPMTISPRRGNGPLTPNAREIRLLDVRGRRFEPSAKGQIVLAAMGLHSTPLQESLRPGDTYVSYLVFEVPRDAAGLKLLVTSAGEEGLLLWDDERSPLHGKAYFDLPHSYLQM